jgi:hypothetical protein
MRRIDKARFRPRFEVFEDRCLLSLAVLEILNKSSYTISFSFHWTTNSAWSTYTEAPGKGEIFWTGYSSFLTPQAFFDPATYYGPQTTVNLVQGYNYWNGTGTPPASAAKLYEFQNTSTGVNLFYVTPPPATPTNAVLEIQNKSTYTITFDFRWSSSSAWTSYTEGPGQGEIFWTTYSSTLTPQALYDTTTSAGSQITVSLAQGYSQWTGTGTPPTSIAKHYGFLNNAGGVKLYYFTGSATPIPNAKASTSTNWSGYVAATSFSNPKTNSVTEVKGSWIIPTVTGPSSGETDTSVWVGIDGYGGNTVEQVGTSQDVINGVAHYVAWWEMYSTGKGQPEQDIAQMYVAPGDSISASVQYMASGSHAGQFRLSIVDNSRSNDSFTTYQSSSRTQSPLASRNGAEWIVEAPTVGGTIARVAAFGSVTFTNASAVINGVSSAINSSRWQSRALNLGSGGVTEDTTSVLTASGTSFVVSYRQSVGTGGPRGTSNATAQLGAMVRPRTRIGKPEFRGPARIQTRDRSGFLTPTRRLGRLFPSRAEVTTG